MKYKAVWNKIKRLKSLYLYDGGNWLYEKKLVVMCMLFITCVVTSCSGNNNGKTEADNIQTQTFPQQYRYSSEHLRIDLQEITPQEVSWKNGTATECSLDYEKVGRVFMPDDGSNTLDAEAQMISSNAVSDGVSESFLHGDWIPVPIRIWNIWN